MMLNTLVELIEDFEEQINSCIGCRVCDENCSLYLASGKLDVGPWKKIDIAKRIISGENVSLDELTKAAYACTLCGICEKACPKNIEITSIVRELRSKLAEENAVPNKITQLCGNIIERGSMTGGGKEFWKKWLPENLKFPEKAENLYLVGCMIPFKIPELGRATAEMLLKAGVDFTILGEEERCCGLLLWEHGFPDEARELAEQNLGKMKKKEAKRIIVSCSACYYAYKEVYPKLLGDGGIEVSHVIEVLMELVENGKLAPKKPIEEEVVYFDACHFTRFTGKYDLPRRLIKSIPGIKLLEFSRSMERGYCCGISSGVKLVFKELTDSVAKMIIEEAKKLGARKIVTSCPLCMYQFASTIKKYGIEGIEAIDIPLLLHQSTT